MPRGDGRDVGLQLLQALVERHRVRAWNAKYDLDAVAAQGTRKLSAAAEAHLASRGCCCCRGSTATFAKDVRVNCSEVLVK